MTKATGDIDHAAAFYWIQFENERLHGRGLEKPDPTAGQYRLEKFN